MKTGYLGLGSNQGDREKNLIHALSLIKARWDIVGISSIFETSPVGYRNQPDFLNMVIEIDVKDYQASRLLEELKAIEKKIGRKPTFRWGPRVIDIDILYIQDIIIESPELTLPHKELLNREFVLIPLSEIVDRLSVHGQMVHLNTRIEEIAAHYDVRSNTGRTTSVKNTVRLYKSRRAVLEELK